MTANKPSASTSPKDTAYGATRDASSALKSELLAAVSEKEFQQQIIDLARTLGWKVFHCYDSRRSEPGWPDLVLIRGITLLALEVKKAGAKEPPPEQVGWIGAFKQVRRVHADFVYPKDFEDLKETLQRALR